MGANDAGGQTLAEKLSSQRESETDTGSAEGTAEVVPPEEAAPAPQQPQDAHEAMVEAAKRARDTGTVPAVARQRTCLVVDDSRVVRKVSRQIAGSLGYGVVEAENGAEALARCKAAMPDLVLTDMEMPVMSGIEFVQTLRALPGGQSAKVVFCTSKKDAQNIHDGIAAGADDYVLKPFDQAALKAKLAKLDS